MARPISGSPTTITVRSAAPDDAEPGALLRRRSIAELCGEDHADDPAVIAAWTANKTSQTFLHWLARIDAVVLVAEDDRGLIGVGMVDDDGWVLLNYVHPARRFAGVSSTLLAALEARARELGLRECRLESTKTAAPFYAARGYRTVDDGSGILSKALPEVA